MPVKHIGIVLLATFAACAADGRLGDAEKAQDRATVLHLLQNHADVNAAQGDGATALHWAAHWDDLKAAEMLIAAVKKVCYA